MGLFWDLYQQSQISEHSDRAESLEARVEHLERANERLATLLREVIGRLEKHVGVDLDQDGRVG
jgi:chaperonin cofactor prefoldin